MSPAAKGSTDFEIRRQTHCRTPRVGLHWSTEVRVWLCVLRRHPGHQETSVKEPLTGFEEDSLPSRAVLDAAAGQRHLHTPVCCVSHVLNMF